MKKQLALFALLALTAGAHAQTYDAAVDFSIASNPNGVWTYGFSTTLGGALTLFDQTAGGATPVWRHSVVQNLGTPAIYRNDTGGVINGLPVGGLALHPGAAELAVLRFTAPSAASYSINTQFLDGDFGQTGATILHNGVTLFSNPATSGNPAFNTTVALLAGDTVDIVVDHAGDGFFNDTTGVAAVIQNASSAPEPGTVALLFVGGLVGTLVRRRLG